MKYPYFRGLEADRYSFYRVPKALIKVDLFEKMSGDAKLLYAVLLDRMNLSLKNGWQDENGNAYIICTIDEIMDSIRCARQKAVKLLELVGITDAEKRFRNYPHQLSGGMRQRVVIAIALSAEPDILICDEPTTALDVTIQSKILDLIKQIQQKMHLSVIYITHDLGVVAKVADYVNVMYAGKIVEVGNVEEIFYEPRHPYTWGLLSAMPDLETADDRLYSIPGSPPNLLHEPVGDAFAARNRFAMVIDKKAEPPLFKVSETHYAATWLLHPDAPAFEMPKELKERLERAKKEAAKYL